MSFFNIFSAKKRLAKQAAIEYAEIYGLGSDVAYCIARGYSPEEALEEWDLLTPEIINILHDIKETS